LVVTEQSRVNTHIDKLDVSTKKRLSKKRKNRQRSFSAATMHALSAAERPIPAHILSSILSVSLPEVEPALNTKIGRRKSVESLPRMKTKRLDERKAVPASIPPFAPRRGDVNTAELTQKTIFTVYLPPSEKKSMILEKNTTLKEVLEKLCKARGLDLLSHKAIGVQGTPVPLDTCLGEIENYEVTLASTT